VARRAAAFPTGQPNFLERRPGMPGIFFDAAPILGSGQAGSGGRAFIEADIAARRLVCPLAAPAWRANDYALVVSEDRARNAAIRSFRKWTPGSATRSSHRYRGTRGRADWIQRGGTGTTALIVNSSYRFLYQVLYLVRAKLDDHSWPSLTVPHYELIQGQPKPVYLALLVLRCPTSMRSV
jgi:hypothetical protein